MGTRNVADLTLKSSVKSLSSPDAKTVLEVTTPQSINNSINNNQDGGDKKYCWDNFLTPDVKVYDGGIAYITFVCNFAGKQLALYYEETDIFKPEHTSSIAKAILPICLECEKRCSVSGSGDSK